MESTTIQTTQRQKKRIIFIALGLLFGYIGLHNFYVRRTAEGLLQAFLTSFLWFTAIIPVIVWMWGVYEALTIKEDVNGNPLA